MGEGSKEWDAAEVPSKPSPYTTLATVKLHLGGGGLVSKPCARLPPKQPTYEWNILNYKDFAMQSTAENGQFLESRTGLYFEAS